MVSTLRVESPVGPLLLGCLDDGICLVEFQDEARWQGRQLEPTLALYGDLSPAEHPLLRQMERELVEYFEGTRTSFDVPLALRGTDFQLRVWNALLEIPFGETRTYGQLAAKLGVDGGSRAVGHANGDNRVAIVVPCHRVIAADGTLGGYGGGLEMKRFLLNLEGHVLQVPLAL